MKELTAGHTQQFRDSQENRPKSWVPQASTLSALPHNVSALPGPGTLCLSLPRPEYLGVMYSLLCNIPIRGGEENSTTSYSGLAWAAVVDSWFHPAKLAPFRVHNRGGM